jgi:excisionase family DNA binding protein
MGSSGWKPAPSAWALKTKLCLSLKAKNWYLTTSIPDRESFSSKLWQIKAKRREGAQDMTAELKDFLSAKELSEVLGVTTDTVLEWRHRGLAFYRIGKRVWFEQHEVAEFIVTHLKGEKINPNSDESSSKTL